MGDKRSDVNLAGVMGGKAILVRTGYGQDEEKKLQDSKSIRPENVEKNLYEAVKYIVDADKNPE